MRNINFTICYSLPPPSPTQHKLSSTFLVTQLVENFRTKFSSILLYQVDQVFERTPKRAETQLLLLGVITISDTILRERKEFVPLVAAFTHLMSCCCYTNDFAAINSFTTCVDVLRKHANRLFRRLSYKMLLSSFVHFCPFKFGRSLLN